MSKEISKSIEIVEFLNILTHTLETSEEANGVQKVIEIFSSKAHLIITDIPNNEVTQNALLSFASIFAEQSGIDASKNITEINTIAQKHNIPINIGYTESSNNHNDISLKEELVDAGVFEMLEQFADGQIESLDIDDSQLVIKYLAYLQYNIIDIPSLYRYLRTCIAISQVDVGSEEISIIDAYVSSSAMGLDDAALSEIFDEYDYLDTDGAIAKEELADCLAEGLSREEANAEVELFLRGYAWIHVMMIDFDDKIITPRITQKKIEGDLENLSNRELFRVYGMINDWLDILDPERYIPERFPTGNPHYSAMYENIAGEFHRIIH